jgi:predicted acyltransferase
MDEPSNTPHQRINVMRALQLTAIAVLLIACLAWALESRTLEAMAALAGAIYTALTAC